MADDNLPFFFHRVSVIVEDARQRINKNRHGFSKGDAMVLTIQAGLAIIPFKTQPHELNFDGSTSRVRINTEFLSHATSHARLSFCDEKHQVQYSTNPPLRIQHLLYRMGNQRTRMGLWDGWLRGE